MTPAAQKLGHSHVLNSKEQAVAESDFRSQAQPLHPKVTDQQRDQHKAGSSLVLGPDSCQQAAAGALCLLGPSPPEPPACACLPLFTVTG